MSEIRREAATRRTAMITGAARGIGAALAHDLVGRGWQVALVGLEPERLGPLAEELGDGADWHEADVTDLPAMEAAVAWAVERFGGVDALVTNAGVATPGTVSEIAPGDFDRTIEVNLMGTWRSVRAALPELRARRGYVLCVASLAAGVHLPLMASYAASKAGVVAFAHALRAEVADDGVDVGVAYLSWIDTDMVRDGWAHPASREFLATVPSWARSTLPVTTAARALGGAVARRARRVVIPRYVLPPVLAAGAFEPLVRRALGRRRGAPQG